MRALAFPFLCLSLFTAGAWAQESASPAPDFEALAERWQAAMADLRVPGLAVVVVRNDEVIYRGTFGIRNADAEPVTPATPFYVASCTKSFVAMALLTLADEGKLDLDAPVRDYLPRFGLADTEATAELTVRELLCHAPGLESDPIVFLDAYTGEITEDRYYRLLRDVAPTGETTYSNVHYTLAGRVLAAITGQPWREALAAQVLQPAGMTQTTGYADAMYAEDDVAIPMVATGTDGGFEPCAMRKTDATMHAAGGLGASIDDLGRWLRLNLGGGEIDGRRVVSADAVRAMQTQQAALPNPSGRLREMLGFGLGWQVGTFRGRSYVQHGGGYSGAAAHISMLTEDKFGVAAVANASASGHALIEVVSIDVYDALLGTKDKDYLPGFARQIEAYMARRATAPEPATEGEGLAAPVTEYAGTYSHPELGTLRVTASDGQLHATLGALRAQLVPTGGERFVLWVEPEWQATGAFTLDGGRPVAALLDVAGAEGERFERAAGDH
ncbi:MAG: serine hydrolase [Planctomycetota bacterium]